MKATSRALALLFALTSRPVAADPAVAVDGAPAEPLVVYVVVPLCDDALIDCGSAIAGRPDGLEHNVYWGAVFGARRFFERRASGWERVEVARGKSPYLERAVFRRYVPGAPWGSERAVEEIVVLDAVRGDAIDQAVDRFWQTATEGGTVTFLDGGRARTARVRVAGYAGHNRLMDGKALPPARPGAREPVPAFVLACKSEPYFGKALEDAGAALLVTTSTLMAPEGYVIEAVARGIGDNLSAVELRARAVAAYAKWQHLTLAQASSVFAKRRSPAAQRPVVYAPHE